MEPILFFDGTCNFCNGSVQFVLKHERAPEFRFAPIQSGFARTRLAGVLGDEGAGILIASAESSEQPTVIILEDDKVQILSTAVLRIVRGLRMPWRLALIATVIPAWIRDALYVSFARNRFRLFGRATACFRPTPQLRARFLA
jgi:predicted DCC family thiol-disulfide oxidoreductase YuxK